MRIVFCTLSVIVCVITTFLILVLSHYFGSNLEGSYFVEIFAVILSIIDIASFVVFCKTRRNRSEHNIQTGI